MVSETLDCYFFFRIVLRLAADKALDFFIDASVQILLASSWTSVRFNV